MTSPGSTSHLFRDTARASRNLKTIFETLIRSGSHFTSDRFEEALLHQLRGSPDPDLALNNLLRFSEATMSKASLFNDLLQHPVLMEVLVKLFGNSQYFADILVRDPELFRWLTATDSLVTTREKKELEEEVARILRMFRSPERALDGLKRFYRRELLRIGARDILENADLATVTSELSTLAEVLIEASCRIAGRQLSLKYPSAPSTPYSVIGLGKLGGSELNYSSDIDILFVYGEEGEITDDAGRLSTHHEYFNKFVEKLVQNLSQPSVEGHLYRVDTRLRPESGAGPRARAFQTDLLYYESRGELWERQMMIKARPVAGDVEFGREFIHQLDPFVYPKTFFEHPAEYIARIKGRIESAVAGDENIKLMAGGIRDIEFIVQALQLLNGGRIPSIRTPNTLQAIDLLADAALLSEQERRSLIDAYIFFRTLEHRLQTMLNTQTHSLPADDPTLTIVARRLGMSASADLRARLDVHMRDVRGIFDNVLSVAPGGGRVSIVTVMEGNISETVISQVLKNCGFHDTRKAAKHLRSMVSGSSLTGRRELDARAQKAFRGVAEQLFADMSSTPDPDMTLQNLATVAAAQKFPEQLYRQLGESNFRKLLLTVCGMSPRFAKVLSRDHLLLETLATDDRSLAGGQFPPLSDVSSLTLKRIREETRAGIRYLLGLDSFNELTITLSRLADAIVAEVLGEKSAGKGLLNMPLAILALGKYGTRELCFDGDLDVIFVGDSKKGIGKDVMEKVAASTVKRLSAVTSEGRLYEIDARLRPEGKSAPLVVERGAYITYLESRASLWERQSLTRLRFVCGDRELAEEVLRDAYGFVYESPLPDSWAESIVSMRRKVETRSRANAPEFCDFKLGAGGMVDIEFLAQMFQLRAGHNQQTLRHSNTPDAIARMAPSIISVDERDLLMEAYMMYRRLELLLRVTMEERGTLLPEGEKLDLFARCFDGSQGVDLYEWVSATMKRIRSLFLEVSQRVANL